MKKARKAEGDYQRPHMHNAADGAETFNPLRSNSSSVATPTQTPTLSNLCFYYIIPPILGSQGTKTIIILSYT